MVILCYSKPYNIIESFRSMVSNFLTLTKWRKRFCSINELYIYILSTFKRWAFQALRVGEIEALTFVTAVQNTVRDGRPVAE